MDAPGEPRPLPVLVSACLLGHRCRYDGGSRTDATLANELAARGEVAVPFCPEERGGLPTPRPAASLDAAADAVLGGEADVRTHTGAAVTREFLAGALRARETCEQHGIRRAYLKERSPSCGVRQTHVRGELRDGPGVTAALLARAGVELIGREG